MPDIVPEKIQKSKQEKIEKVDEKVYLEKEGAGQEQEKFSGTDSLEKFPQEKPAKISIPKTTKKQTASIKGLQRQRQVKILADLAMEKGVHYAVAMAKKMESAYVLDELHDTLVDELYEELKNRGLL